MYTKENLTKLKRMDSLAPQVMKAFWAFDKAAVAEGAIPVKYKELIAIAVALTTQCPYCIEAHVRAAKKAGATPEELAERLSIASCEVKGIHRRGVPDESDDALRDRRRTRGWRRLECAPWPRRPNR